MTTDSDRERQRIYLRAVMKIMTGLGVITLAWVALSFVATVDDPELRVEVERISIARLGAGETDVFNWNGRPLLVLRRSPEMLSVLEQQSTQRLVDPASDKSKQPESMKNDYRSAQPEWLVLLATGMDLGCPVSFLPAGGDSFQRASWQGGFKDTCRGSRYDLAGRVYKEQQAQENLEVPKYRIEGDTLVVGAL